MHLTAECWPFARTGGLGEAVSGLATAQARTGAPVTIVMPLYRLVREHGQALERVGLQFPVSIGTRTEYAHLYRPADPAPGPAVYFIEHPGFFDRSGIYGDEGGDYADNAVRFAFFCKAALTALPTIAPAAEVLHAHDWHTALAGVYLRTGYCDQPYYRRLATLLSVHNAGFQGHYTPRAMALLGLAPELYHWQAFEWYDQVNVLKGGIAFSDMVATVSPTHARELCTPQGGFGLHDTFTALGDRLVGILNGIDVDIWDPATDPHLPAHYDAGALQGKRQSKAALQQAYDLAVEPDTPLFGMSARLVQQKGLDLVLRAASLSSVDAQFVFLGCGEHRYHEALGQLAAAYPDRVVAEFAFSDHLEHRLLAGADFLLMPSLYEPCGLTQMRAQRYGAIPIVRAVGGLRDSVSDGDTGFLFDDYSPGALDAAVHRVLDAYTDRRRWRTLMRRAMTRPLGWGDSTAQYAAVYQRAIAARAAA
ncbi:MAG TPA: glycogen/starch synthase [Gemmatimonadales bacterium]